MENLKVLRYQPHTSTHQCYWQERDKEIWVDIMVDGAFPDKKPEELIGLTLQVRAIRPYEYIAHDITVLPAN